MFQKLTMSAGLLLAGTAQRVVSTSCLIGNSTLGMHGVQGIAAACVNTAAHASLLQQGSTCNSSICTVCVALSPVLATFNSQLPSGLVQYYLARSAADLWQQAAQCTTRDQHRRIADLAGIVLNSRVHTHAVKVLVI
jgi:hypothetical protein